MRVVQSLSAASSRRKDGGRLARWDVLCEQAPLSGTGRARRHGCMRSAGMCHSDVGAVGGVGQARRRLPHGRGTSPCDRNQAMARLTSRAAHHPRALPRRPDPMASRGLRQWPAWDSRPSSSTTCSPRPVAPVGIDVPDAGRPAHGRSDARQRAFRFRLLRRADSSGRRLEHHHQRRQAPDAEHGQDQLR